MLSWTENVYTYHKIILLFTFLATVPPISENIFLNMMLVLLSLRFLWFKPRNEQNYYVRMHTKWLCIWYWITKKKSDFLFFYCWRYVTSYSLKLIVLPNIFVRVLAILKTISQFTLLCCGSYKIVFRILAHWWIHSSGEHTCTTYVIKFRSQNT